MAKEVIIKRFTYFVIWDGRDEKGASVASGVYFYRLAIQAIGETKSFANTKKMVVLE